MNGRLVIDKIDCGCGHINENTKVSFINTDHMPTGKMKITFSCFCEKCNATLLIEDGNKLKIIDWSCDYCSNKDISDITGLETDNLVKAYARCAKCGKETLISIDSAKMKTTIISAIF